MRVLAAIVAPPHLTASGGAKAGELLSATLASSCDMTVASMMDGPVGAQAGPGAGKAARVPVRSHLPLLYPSARAMTRYRALFYRSNIPQIVRSGNYDLVHLHNPTPALEMARVARACRAAKIPYVVSTHGFNEVANGRAIYGFDPIRRELWKRLVEAPVAEVVRQAAAVFALSPADFGIVRSMGFAGAISVVSNGVPIPAAAEPKSDETVLERFGLSPAGTAGPLTCMFLANHTPNKGLPHLLDAFAALEMPYQLIVGGDTRDGIDYERAKRRCRPGQSVIVTGRLLDAEVAALLRRSDLFVFPTLADTFPLVVLEAMSHGLPVIASDVGGIPYQLGGNCGLVVPPGDVPALAAAIAELARDAPRRAEIGRNALLRVERDYSWESAAALALAGYQQVLSRRPRTAPLRAGKPHLVR
jgi:glycosyltransferase involved in cell wall biosynthesis